MTRAAWAAGFLAVLGVACAQPTSQPSNGTSTSSSGGTFAQTPGNGCQCCTMFSLETSSGGPCYGMDECNGPEDCAGSAAYCCRRGRGASNDTGHANECRSACDHGTPLNPRDPTVGLQYALCLTDDDCPAGQRCAERPTEFDAANAFPATNAGGCQPR